jgi:hypothetical protein
LILVVVVVVVVGYSYPNNLYLNLEYSNETMVGRIRIRIPTISFIQPFFLDFNFILLSKIQMHVGN